MSAEFIPDAYLERISYKGSSDPNFQTLSRLLLAHTAAIPFENLDVLLGRPIKIDLDSVQQKLVRDRRGGYCFEHGTLFYSALKHLGFDVILHSARVTLFVHRSEAPRTHMFMSVNLPEGTFVADPGFGGLAPRFPLRVPDIHGPEHDAEPLSHVLVKDDMFYTMLVVDGDRTVDAWSSTLEPENRIDYVLGNHYTSTHPDSQFVNRLMLRAFSGDTIVSVMNRDVSIRHNGRHNGYVESTKLADRKELRSLLNEHFGFDLPEVETIKVPSIPEWN